MKKQKYIYLFLFLLLSFLSSQFQKSTDVKSVKDIQLPSIQNASTFREKAMVVRVVDGDTITVSLNGIQEKVRLIGINTPESVDPRQKVECFGKEASLKLQEILDNKSILLEKDPSQNDRDRYGRLLRFVLLEEGLIDVGKQLLTTGYAHEYTYNTPYAYQKEYKAAEKDAQKNNLGLWAVDACNNNTPSA